MTKRTEAFALITGASKGIGKALANEIASRGWNLALTALPGEGLEEVAEELRKKHNCKVKTFETDLAVDGAGQVVYDWWAEDPFPLSMIVNNAGFGTLGKVKDNNLAVHMKMIRLHVDTPYTLIRLFMEELSRHEKAYIINISSQAAFFPIPWKAAYGATKAFLFNFSQALQWEMRDTNIHVSCVAPTGVLTTPEVRARIQAAGTWSRWAALEPEKVAEIILRCTLKGKRLIVPGWVNKLVQILSWVFPTWLSMTMAENRFSREVEPVEKKKEVPEEEKEMERPAKGS